MAAFRMIASIGAMLGALMVGASVQAADTEFTGSKFTCLQFTNGLGANSSTKVQSSLARLWMMGYLTGFYKGQNKLEMSDDKADEQKIDSRLVDVCKENPQNSILSVASQAIAIEAHKMPKTLSADFAPGTYTCGQHVDARAGSAGDANKADIAELWVFAFVQGYKNVASPGLEIPVESKAPIIGAINKTCAANRGLLYMDLAALVADKVKLEGGK